MILYFNGGADLLCCELGERSELTERVSSMMVVVFTPFSEASPRISVMLSIADGTQFDNSMASDSCKGKDTSLLEDCKTHSTR